MPRFMFLPDGINYNPGKEVLVLYEITARGEKVIPCQVEPGHLTWF